MKISQKGCKRFAVAAVMLAPLFCAACGEQAQRPAPPERDYLAEAKTVAAACAAKEDCFLCGTGATCSEFFGQNNVGLISLNTFAYLPVEINRYDRMSGQLIEENTGTIQIRTLRSGDAGLEASLMLDSDRGIANLTVSPGEDSTLNLADTARFLCADCLTELASQLHGSVFGYVIVNFSTGRLYAIRDSIVGFDAGDYYVHCDYDGLEGKTRILITYCPLRYENEA